MYILGKNPREMFGKGRAITVKTQIWNLIGGSFKVDQSDFLTANSVGQQQLAASCLFEGPHLMCVTVLWWAAVFKGIVHPKLIFILFIYLAFFSQTEGIPPSRWLLWCQPCVWKMLLSNLTWIGEGNMMFLAKTSTAASSPKPHEHYQWVRDTALLLFVGIIRHFLISYLLVCVEYFFCSLPVMLYWCLGFLSFFLHLIVLWM